MNGESGPSPLNRRAFVSASSSILVSGVAGCLDDSNGQTGDGEADENDVSADALFTVSLGSIDVSDEQFVTVVVNLEDAEMTADDPARLTVTLENVTDEDLTIRGRTVWPFGLVRAHPKERSGRDILLWSETYQKSDYVELTEGRITGEADTDVDRDLEVGESVSRTFEIRANPPHLEEGTHEGGFRFGAAPTGDWDTGTGVRVNFDLDLSEVLGYEDEHDVVKEDPRVDEAPYDIDEPELPDDADIEEQIEKWNDDYLGEHMETAPSLEFDRFGPVRLRSPVLREYDVDEFRVCVIEDEVERDATFVLESLGDSERAAFEEVDFDEQVLILVETGWGSGSVNHQWARIEEVDDGLHLHGYYSSPFEQTDDLATRLSALVVDRPGGDLELFRVSLTTGEERRVHFNSTEGIVSIE